MPPGARLACCGPQPAFAVAVYGSAITTSASWECVEYSISRAPKRLVRCLLRWSSSALIGPTGSYDDPSYSRGSSDSNRTDGLLWLLAAEDGARQSCLFRFGCGVPSRPTRAPPRCTYPDLCARASTLASAQDFLRSRRTFRTGGGSLPRSRRLASRGLSTTRPLPSGGGVGPTQQVRARSSTSVTARDG